MKKILFAIFALTCFSILTACKEEKAANDTITFGTAADYPPFQLYKDGKVTGFEVELAELIAKQLNKKAVVKDMQFSAILPSLEKGDIDVAIATITITPEREKNFDFSNSYYLERFAIVYPKDHPIAVGDNLAHKKIAVQLGTTMEEWLKRYTPDAEITSFDANNQAIEALKGGHVDGVLIDTMQGSDYSKQNAGLAYVEFAQSDYGYGMAMKKGSTLRPEINKTLQALEANGELEKLKKKWMIN